MEIGEARIKDIEPAPKSRDDMPALLTGLQHLYRNEETREALFCLLDRHVLPGRDRRNGRPGMEPWRIPVTGVPGRVPAATGCTSWSTSTARCAGSRVIRVSPSMTGTRSGR